MTPRRAAVTVADFVVHGIAQPAGSKRAVPTPRGVRVIDDAKKSRSWKQQVAAAAADYAKGYPVALGPLRLQVLFEMPRPKSHYRSDGTLKPNAPRLHTVRPDATKLVRAVEDALTGVIWHDDAQITEQLIAKRYGDSACTHVLVEEYEEA